jgi:predicted DNA-binding transcriptional regulator AlpA
MTTQLLDIDGAARVTGLRPVTIRQYLWRGTFPSPDVRLGRSPGWFPETIAAWMAARPTHR